MIFGNKGLSEDYRSLCISLGVDELYGSDTYRMSHTECGDTRRRLYFTSAHEDGRHIVKAYCHNCQVGGVCRPATMPSYAVVHATSTEDVTENDPPTLPADTMHVDTAPYPIRGYFRTYGLEPEDVGAVWSPSMGRIILPVHDVMIPDKSCETRYLGYLARALPGAPPCSAKWLSAHGAEPLQTWCGMMPLNKALVFTEDMLSAAVVSKAFPGCVGVPLFGLNIQPEYVLKRMKDFPECRPIVWLDNDEPSKRPRERLAAVLRAFGYRPDVIVNLDEPKKVPWPTIRRTLALRLDT